MTRTNAGVCRLDSGARAGGNAHHTYNIAALDARSMAEVLKRHPDAVAKAVQKAVRGHHLHL